MFERYTEKARRTIFFARYEASQYGSPAIETEHLLLGWLREEKGMAARVLPTVNFEAIRQKVDAHAPQRARIHTSVDLPLSKESKQVLSFAAEEADKLEHRHIGTEHLLLGLLRVEKSFGAQLLQAEGETLEAFRERMGRAPASWVNPPRYPRIEPRRRDRATVEIHGARWDADRIREIVARCRESFWYWHKRAWKPQDIVIERSSGRTSFDLTLAAGSSNFELQPGGWKKGHCAVCSWELFESEPGSDHGEGYTNGQMWLCTECYRKFIEGPDFFGSAYSEIT